PGGDAGAGGGGMAEHPARGRTCPTSRRARTALRSTVGPRTPAFVDKAEAMRERLAELDTALAAAVAGGGARYTERHHARGKLLARERIELLLDRDCAFLELCPVAGWGTDHPTGAGVAGGIGVVEGVECVVIA